MSAAFHQGYLTIAGTKADVTGFLPQRRQGAAPGNENCPGTFDLHVPADVERRKLRRHPVPAWEVPALPGAQKTFACGECAKIRTRACSPPPWTTRTFMTAPLLRPDRNFFWPEWGLNSLVSHGTPVFAGLAWDGGYQIILGAVAKRRAEGH